MSPILGVHARKLVLGTFVLGLVLASGEAEARDSPDVAGSPGSGEPIARIEGDALVLRGGGVISLSSLPAGETLVIDVVVDVDNPLPGGTTQLSSQVDVTGSNFTTEPTDDPATGADDDPTVTVVVIEADLAVTKTNGTATSIPGQPTVYTIVAANHGPSDVLDAQLIDIFSLPLANCAFTSVAAGGASGNTVVGAGNLSETLSLPAGSSVTYTATCDVDPAATGSMSNTATIDSATIPDPVPGNDSATDVDTLTVTADLEITKNNGTATSVPGQPTTYTIVATNQGPSTVTDAAVADAFPGTLSNCTTASVAAGGASGNTAAGTGDLADTLSMPPGSSVTYTATCDVDPSATGSLANTATVSSAIATETDAGDNSATDTDTLEVTADLEITKDNGAATSVPGQPTTYTIVVTNQGPSTVTDAAVADTFPGVLSNCTTTSVAAGGASGNTAAGTGDLADTLSMPPGSSVTYTATCDVDPSATGSLANTATVSSAIATETDAGDNSATDTDTLEVTADLEITKDNGTATSVPGQPTTYTIVVVNQGPSTVTDAAVADTFPGILSNCAFTSVAAGGASGNTAAGAGDLAETLSMPPGSSVTYTATCDVDPAATGSLSNTATVSSAIATETDPGDDSATDTDTLEVTADLEITKDNGTATSVPGQPTTYTIVVVNQGPSTVTDAAVADAFPGGLSNCAFTSVAAGGASGNTAAGAGDLADTLSMPPGSSVTYTATCDVDPAATGSLSNTATVSSAIATETDPGDDSATDIDTLEVTADLEITKDNGTTMSSAGQPTTYTIVVANQGPSTVTDAAVADTFPGILSNCTFTSVAAGGASGNTAAGAGDLAETLSMPPGSSVTYTATCDVDPAATGSLSNTATVSSAIATETDPGDDSATDTDALVPTTDLRLEKTADPTSAGAGETVLYTLTVFNDGPGDATGVVVTDTLPGEVTLVATSGCAEDPSAVPTCTLGAIPASGSASYTIEVTVDPAPPAQFTNTASVESDNGELDDSDNSDSAEVVVDVEPPRVVAVASDAGTFGACETLRHAVTRLELVFSEPMARLATAQPADPGDDGADAPLTSLLAPEADDPDNYFLMRPGADRSFQTVACNDVQGDDLRVAPGGVAYGADTPTAPQATVTLAAAPTRALFADDLYRLIACGNITDEVGNPLDGDGDGTSDGTDDLVVDFRIERLNRFDNGHFDCDLGAWTVEPPGTVQVDHDAEDFEMSTDSGSAAVAFAGEEAFGLSQCVEVDGGDRPFRLSSRLRLDAGAGVQVLAVRACRFFDAPACGGADLGQAVDPLLLANTGGAFVDKAVPFEFEVPPDAVSALCGVTLDSLDEAVFEAYADHLFVGVGDTPLFRDGFESGDLSAWAASSSRRGERDP